MDAPAFAVGMNKTGTTSLKSVIADALQIPAYHYYGNAERVQALQAGDKSAFAAGSFYCDWPLYCHVPLLLESYPTAKFILTVRDIDAYIVSRMVHVLANRLRVNVGGDSWTDIATAYDAEEYAKHIYDVRQLFADRPEQLMVCNVCDVAPHVDLLPQISDFLGVPVVHPHYVWPHANPGTAMLYAAAKELTLRYSSQARASKTDTLLQHEEACCRVLEQVDCVVARLHAESPNGQE